MGLCLWIGFTDEVHPKGLIRGEEFSVLEHYPKNSSRTLEYAKKMIAPQHNSMLMGVLWNMTYIILTVKNTNTHGPMAPLSMANMLILYFCLQDRFTR